MEFTLVFLLKKMWVAFASYSHFFFSKNNCELDTVLTKTDNILTTNELVKLTTFWTTGPWSSAIFVLTIYCSKSFLNLTTLWANTEDNKLMILFSYKFPESRIWRFMQIVCFGDNLHEMSNLFSGKNKNNISGYRLLEILPRVLGV